MAEKNVWEVIDASDLDLVRVAEQVLAERTHAPDTEKVAELNRILALPEYEVLRRQWIDDLAGMAGDALAAGRDLRAAFSGRDLRALLRGLRAEQGADWDLFDARHAADMAIIDSIRAQREAEKAEEKTLAEAVL